MSSTDSPLRQPLDFKSLTTTKPFSIALGVKAQGASKPSATSKKRPHSSLADDSDSDHDSQQGPQLVAGFDRSAGGAISLHSSSTPKGPLVIPAQKNRDWREESRRKKSKNLLPAEERALRTGKGDDDGEDILNRPQQYGLLVAAQRNDSGGDVVTDAIESSDRAVEGKAKTADEEAIEALLGDGKRKSALVLPTTTSGLENGFAARSADERAFQSDIASRPESASLADYEAVPIEEFGAALLRGMGWKEGEGFGRQKGQAVKPRVLERRPALLGIGAKQVPEGLEELGAWGKGAKKAKREEHAPVVLRNSKTGETLTEEELKERQDKNRAEETEWRERRDKNLAIDDERRRRDRDRHRKDEHRASRHGSSRRDRSRSPARGHRRDDYDYSGSSRRSSSRRKRSRSRSSEPRRRDRERNGHDDTRPRRRQEVY